MDGSKETILLTKDIIPESASYGIKINDDSMKSEFEDGKIAWVLKQDMVENGEIGIFSLNGEAYIKKLQDDQNGVFLICLSEKYPPILKNIYDEGELTESSTISKMEIVQSEGSRQVKRNVDFYNLDAITCDKQKNIGIIWIKDIPEYTKGFYIALGKR